MEDQTTIFHKNKYIQLHNTCKVQCKNYKRKQRFFKRFWSCHHKNSKNKHRYTNMDIILYAPKPTKVKISRTRHH